MKGIIAVLMLLAAFAGLPADAAGRSETLRVQINQEKRASKSKLLVRFVELVEDSRCPTDTNCIWAGNAKIKLRVTKAGRAHDLTLDTQGENQSAKAEGFTIRLVGLTPEPRSNIRINRNGYVAALSITK